MTSPEMPHATPMPDPIDVARRISEVTGIRSINPDTRLFTGFIQNVLFDVGEEGGLSQASVNVQRYSADTRVLDGQEVSAHSQYSLHHIGYFNPVTEEWVLYPEFVLPEERAGLAMELEEIDQIDRTMKQISALAVDGEPFIDPRHPLTLEANKKMAQVLQDSGLAARLLRDNPSFNFGNTVHADEYTMARFLLTPDYNDQQAGYESPTKDNEYGQDLTVAYDGAILTNDAGEALRSSQDFVVASRSKQYPAVWLPNLALITVEEWKQIEHIPQQLLSYREQTPNFSTEHCAVLQGFTQQTQKTV